MPTPGELEAQIRELWDFGDPEKSYHWFIEAGETSSDLYSQLVFSTQAARALGLSGRFDDARTRLEAIVPRVSEVESMPERDHVAARLEIETGRILNSAGRAADATTYFESAERLARRAQVPGLAIDAIHMLAIVAPDPGAARAHNERAIREAQASDDPAARRWIGSLLNNLGWAYHDAGEFAEALDAFRRAEEFFDGEGTEEQRFIARWAVARVLRSLERYDEALVIQEQLLTEPSSSEDGFVSEELGELMLALGRPDEATAHFARAHRLLSLDPRLAEQEKPRMDRIAVLAGSGG